MSTAKKNVTAAASATDPNASAAPAPATDPGTAAALAAKPSTAAPALPTGRAM